MSEPEALTLRGIRRSFGDNVVLDGLDLEVPKGQFVALLGHSGCGKSTLLRIIAGLDADADGEVDKPRCAVVFQEPRLLPWKRVLPNVTLGLNTDDRVATRARAVLAEVGLASHEKAWPYTLSGGGGATGHRAALVPRSRVAPARRAVRRARRVDPDQDATAAHRHVREVRADGAVRHARR